ncbi:hypothetical protein IV203_034004 [Nitzschia inconspicua]|uniref:Uncharacterized protein n=1 Tax=Nitzschia inconspicua TaxID=303405 RepID=A0A9K3M3E3_9STRA|nr:hypothetical protein IV203_034004 [Nitzschia inconspicua]
MRKSGASSGYGMLTYDVTAGLATPSIHIHDVGPNTVVAKQLVQLVEYTQYQCWEAEPSILVENKAEASSEQAVELAGRRFCLPSPSEALLVEHKVDANSEQAVELAGKRFCLSSSSEVL